MNTPSEEPTRNAQVTREDELEQAKSSLHEELTEGRALLPPAAEEEEQARPQTRTRPRRSSRRKMLTKGLGMAAVASVATGALLELSGGTALASSVKPGVFASGTAGTPAVKATGTNGAHGMDATSDSGIGVTGSSTSSTGVAATSSSGTGLFALSSSGAGVVAVSSTSGIGVFGSSDTGTGVSATSTSGTGLVATSSSGLAGHFMGNVNMDNNLTVTGALSTGTLSSGAGALASSVGGTPAVKATGTNGADGVDASSDGGSGVAGSSVSGIGVIGDSASFIGVLGRSSFDDGVRGISSSAASFVASVHGLNLGGGFAGWFDGDVHVVGNLSATGMKPFVQAHPTDPSREIVYVALEGGEAGTYVRGSGQLQSGKAVLALPEHFGLVTDNEGLTVHLTPRGAWLQLYVVELDTAQLVVREAQGKSGAFDYLIHGVRRGYEQHEVLRTKR